MARRNSFLTLVGGALLATACGTTNPGTDTGTGNDAAIDTPATPGQTYSFVVSELKLDTRTDSMGNQTIDTSAANPHTGFNVDGRFSDSSDMQGCLVPDFYAKNDTDQHMPAGCAMAPTGCKGGVDNQLLAVADALAVAAGDINALAKTNIDQSKLVILIRLGDVNSLTADPSITLKLYLGYAAFSTACTAVTPDRMYAIAQDSLTTGSSDIENAKFTFNGSIEAGRIKVTRNGAFTLPLPPIMGRALDLALNNTQLRMDVTADAGQNGNIGGWVKGNDIRNAVLVLAPGMGSLIDSLLPQFLDVVDPANTATPMQQCIMANSAMPAQWGGISLGFGLKMVKAQIATAPLPAAGAGVCGNQSGSGG